jgi:hypothetical protein
MKANLDGIVNVGPIKVGFHYLLACYICGPACVRSSPFGEGWTTFAQIFQSRPDGCRYAIAQMVPLKVSGDLTTTVRSAKQPEGAYIVWDLLDDTLTNGKALREKGYLPTPEPLWQHESLDGMIMKAMALYDQPQT